MDTQLDHLNLSVRSFEESVDWYGRVFGFALVEQGERDGVQWGVIRAGSGEAAALLCIYEYPQRESLDGDALKERAIHGFNHFGLRVHERDAWLETIKREKLEVLYDGVVRWPHAEAWYIKDPTGYEIEVALWEGDRIAFDPIS